MRRLLASRCASALAAPLLALALAGCAPGPIVAPLRYGALPLAPDEAFRARAPAWPTALPDLALPFDVTALPNGVTVVHVPRHGLPSVAIRLVMARGPADLRAPLDTLALLEEMLDGSAEPRSGSELAASYAQLGASQSFSCEDDGCEVATSVGAADFDAALGLVAATAIRPRFTPFDFSVVRRRWMLRFLSSQHSVESSLARNTAAQLFGAAHPYGFAVFPSDHTRSLTVNDVVALHAQLSHPTYATLVVVGDVTREAVAASATRWLGGWTSASAPWARPPLPAPEASSRRVVIVNKYQRLQCSAWVGVAVPSADDAEAAAVAVLVRSLGGVSTALREEVRDGTGAAYSFSDVTELRRGATLAGFRGELNRDKAQGAIKAILAAIRKARSSGVPAGDVALAQTNLIAEWQARASTLKGLADLTSGALERGVAPAALAAWPARLAAVTPAAVQRAAQRYFTEASLRVTVVGDFRWLEDLDDLGLGDYQLRDGFAELVP